MYVDWRQLQMKLVTTLGDRSEVGFEAATPPSGKIKQE